MNHFGDVSYVAKRKHKRLCAICGRGIVAGDRVKRWCSADGPYLLASVAHAVCLALAYKESGNGELEWHSRCYLDDASEETVNEYAKALEDDRKKPPVGGGDEQHEEDRT